MIKASYLQQQATKYRKLARAEESLEMRRQLFALASRCDELAVTMERAPARKLVAKLAIVKKTVTAASPSTAPNNAVVPQAATPALPFSAHSHARLVHRIAN